MHRSRTPSHVPNFQHQQRAPTRRNVTMIEPSNITRVIESSVTPGVMLDIGRGVGLAPPLNDLPRNDTPRLRQIAAIAKAWFGRDRTRLAPNIVTVFEELEITLF